MTTEWYRGLSPATSLQILAKRHYPSVADPQSLLVRQRDEIVRILDSAGVQGWSFLHQRVCSDTDVGRWVRVQFKTVNRRRVLGLRRNKWADLPDNQYFYVPDALSEEWIKELAARSLGKSGREVRLGAAPPIHNKPRYLIVLGCLLALIMLALTKAFDVLRPGGRGLFQTGMREALTALGLVGVLAFIRNTPVRKVAPALGLVLPISAGFAYAAARTCYAAYLEPLGVTPESIGLDYRSILGTQFIYLMVRIIGAAMVAMVAVGAYQLIKPRESASRVLAATLVSLAALLICLTVLQQDAVVATRRGAEVASDAAVRSGDAGLFYYPPVYRALVESAVTVTPGTSPQLAVRPNVVFLGTNAGQVSLFDVDKHATLLVPQNTVRVALFKADRVIAVGESCVIAAERVPLPSNPPGSHRYPVTVAFVSQASSPVQLQIGQGPAFNIPAGGSHAINLEAPVSEAVVCQSAGGVQAGRLG
jgi:hypothetical protein